MAPTASNPKDLKLLLNPARRRALALLVNSTISYMRSRIELSFETATQSDTAPLFVNDQARDASQSSNSSEKEEETRQRQLDARLERSLSTPKIQELKRQALRYFDSWGAEVRGQLRKTCEGAEDPRSDQRRREWQAARDVSPPAYSQELDVKNPAFEAPTKARESFEQEYVSVLQKLYPPIPTRLATISSEDRVYLISSMVLIFLSLGHYSAHSRVLLCYLTSSLSLPLSTLTNEEYQIAQTLLLASKTLTADAETQKRQAENASARRWKVGLASLAGAAVIGVTGGLAAPVVAGAIGGIMGGVGLGGLASFLGIFAMNGALVGTLFGAYGAKMTGEMVDSYAKEVEDFKFLSVAEERGEFGTKPENELHRLRVTIGINGWLNEKDDVVKPWRVLGDEDSEVFALRYEMDALLALGTSLRDMVSSYTWSFVKLEILKRTVLASLSAALWPIYLLKMATNIDNPFAVARNRSEKAGEVLADALINKCQGERPVTLVGYSLGARVIYSCLKSLAERQAFGLVENVVFIGSPVPSADANWRAMRAVVSGKLVNVYSENDYILGFLYRATSLQYGVAGLQKIKNVEGIENLDLTKEVSGHLRYPDLVGKILKRVGCFEGVKVENEIIEGDISEISLVDVETEGFRSGPNTYQRVERGQTDLLGLMDGDPLGSGAGVQQVRKQPDLSQITAGMMDLNMSQQPMKEADVSQITSGLMDLKMNPQPMRTHSEPLGVQSHASLSQEISRQDQNINPHTAHPYSPQPSHPQTEPQLNHAALASTFTQIQPQRQDPAYDSDSDSGGGIQMLDNDSDYDGELQELDCEPIPDDDFASPSSSGYQPQEPRDSGKMAISAEPKTLGSFRDAGRQAAGSIQPRLGPL